YQLIFLDKVPSPAAVNESVILAKRFGHKASAGFVNAVLRNISSNKDTVKYPGKADIIKYLSVKHSYPEWMTEKWVLEYGDEFAEKLMEAGNEKPGYTIRANTLLISPDRLAEKLAKSGFSIHPGKYVRDSLIVENPSGILNSFEYDEGLFSVQDESSMLSVNILDPKPGETVIDVCSAPGGKASYAAQLMNNSGRIIAYDIYENKLNQIRQTAERLGIKIVEAGIHDAQTTDIDLAGSADRVIADVPCTGFGIIRRKPDIKWVRKKGDSKELAKIQKKILKAASAYLKPGGTMVYSTCTYGREENEDIVSEFIKYDPDFELVDFSDMLPEFISTHESGMLQLFPDIHGADGFFIAKIKRRAVTG
ncbi:MAG: 16S rRNA (cytosine(967)-C(5))-methyltransferase RsmB, partial [Eubacteriales bacterium]|nr:16S rRNA (cytosine(967)-C(5))-methyltransferase RsmB [Eubacteriales bacterium]